MLICLVLCTFPILLKSPDFLVTCGLIYEMPWFISFAFLNTRNYYISYMFLILILFTIFYFILFFEKTFSPFYILLSVCFYFQISGNSDLPFLFELFKLYIILFVLSLHFFFLSHTYHDILYIKMECLHFLLYTYCFKSDIVLQSIWIDLCVWC